MFGRRRSLDLMRAELREAEAHISAHPFASQRIRAAYDIVTENKTRGAAAVDQELADSGLPSAVELGRVHVAGTWTWWRLHRRKRQLQREIGRRDDR
jgi:hypothetical protein